ncbi:hypothetical protein AURDEDRAFT_176428 [Auricularia subglabra TFB-10046 SS5]|uniref:Uncharacterized protein n=1 Tax=Auricularia subglabra (strain TFB-10046 / SS5) TaxID=717982 RepID=J0WRG0_AURST|nr:hypothetical protein AURDEDRAFT_176428 [Auricularia subglabra TFB-10046 SS5]
MRIDGRLEFLIGPDADAQPRARRRRRRPRVPCASPGCSSQRRGTCSRALCWTHCVRLEEPCGCREHDKERERRPRGRASPSPSRRSPRRRVAAGRSSRRHASKSASPRRRASNSVSPRRRPSKSASPRGRASNSASSRRRPSKSASPRRRASKSASYRRHPSKSASPHRRGRDESPRRRESEAHSPDPHGYGSDAWIYERILPAPPPPFTGVPSMLEIFVTFTDTGFRTHICIPRVREDFYFDNQDEEFWDRLHLNEAKYGTLTVLHHDGTWSDPCGDPVPFFHDQPDDEVGYIYIHAQTMGDLTMFPASYYADMAERLSAFQNFTGDRKHPMTDEEAFFTLFDFEATPAQLEQLDLCLSVVKNSPPRLREQFAHAGRTPKGTWTEFVRECEQHKDTPAATRVLCQSPLVRRQRPGARRSPEADPSRRRGDTMSPEPGPSRRRRRGDTGSPKPGPSRRRETSLPEPGSSRGRDTSSPELSSSRGRDTLSPDLGDWPEPSSSRGPPSTDAGSSGVELNWDDDDDLYD